MHNARIPFGFAVRRNATTPANVRGASFVRDRLAIASAATADAGSYKRTGATNGGDTRAQRNCGINSRNLSDVTGVDGRLAAK